LNLKVKVRKSKMRWENLRKDEEDPYVLVNPLGLGPLLLMFVGEELGGDFFATGWVLKEVWQDLEIEMYFKSVCKYKKYMFQGRCLFVFFFFSFDIDDCYALEFYFTFELYHIVGIYSFLF